MGEYEGCGVCKHTNVDVKEYPCRECIHNVATIQDYYKPMTNADRIRNMTDEELAGFLEGFTVCDHCEYYKNERCAMENPCVHAFAEAMAFKWLQAEVEEGE